MARNSMSSAFARGARRGYRASSRLNALAVYSSGNPKRIARHVKNRALSRALWKAGVWK